MMCSVKYILPNDGVMLGDISSHHPMDYKHLSQHSKAIGFVNPDENEQLPTSYLRYNLGTPRNVRTRISPLRDDVQYQSCNASSS